MCGIVGLVAKGERRPDPSVVRAMADALVHRGPDGDGYFADAVAGLGHRRLSIIDPTGSPQPMATPDERFWLSFNGEIFNYRELRAGLESAGWRFRHAGDTEVLLALLAREGAAALGRVRGQFAFALWDARERELLLGRDRLGVLPLYWCDAPEAFLFGSEIKALLAALGRVPECDPESVREYLAYRSVPAPHTLFRGIRKLEAGHVLRRRADGRVESAPYWSLPAQAPERDVAPEQAVAEVRSALEEAVRLALVADVPVGAYLSGGVDSSLIVALMTRLRGGAPVDTYSAGFDDPRFDELPFARQVSERLGTRHHEVIVKPEDFRALWPQLTWHRDAPLSEPADVALYQLASAARSSVKVLLSGEGSDELFAGYPKYAAAGWAELASRIDAFGALRALERILPPGAGRLRIALRAAAASDAAERARAWFAPFTEYERRALFPGPERSTHRDVWDATRGDRVRRMLLADCKVWLTDNLLERGDRMSMAASVELRPPFMDHPLVELAFALPTSVKLRDRAAKWVIKQVASELLPREIVERRKVGFRVPLDAWFRGGLRDLARDLLTAPASFVAGLLDRRAIAALLEGHERGRRNEELRIWTLLGLEIWHRAF